MSLSKEDCESVYYSLNRCESNQISNGFSVIQRIFAVSKRAVRSWKFWLFIVLFFLIIALVILLLLTTEHAENSFNPTTHSVEQTTVTTSSSTNEPTNSTPV